MELCGFLDYKKNIDTKTNVGGFCIEFCLEDAIFC